MIIVTRAFQKEMKGFSSDILNEIKSLIAKYHRGLETNLFVIQDFGEYLVLKGYLQGKSVRIIIAKSRRDTYIPLALYKKESRTWYNIRDDFDAKGCMNRMETCIRNDEFEVFEVN